jgi:hypothetical protein
LSKNPGFEIEDFGHDSKSIYLEQDEKRPNLTDNERTTLAKLIRSSTKVIALGVKDLNHYMHTNLCTQQALVNNKRSKKMQHFWMLGLIAL